ncbi:ferredoxin [Streptomyces puniciscabiei]
MNITIDLSLCNGYGNCVMEAPAIFDLDERTGMGVVLEESPAEERRALVEAAARTCPVQAIRVQD